LDYHSPVEIIPGFSRRVPQHALILQARDEISPLGPIFAG
jgi:hypothetical protein